MSGTNRLINSIVTKKGGSLVSALTNANNEAKKQDIKGGKKAKK